MPVGSVRRNACSGQSAARMAGIFVDPPAAEATSMSMPPERLFRQPFTPTKAMRRARAIAADRTRPSLTGGCSRSPIFRISTEFLPDRRPDTAARGHDLKSFGSGSDLAAAGRAIAHEVPGVQRHRHCAPSPLTATAAPFDRARRHELHASTFEASRDASRASVGAAPALRRSFVGRGALATVSRSVGASIAALQRWRILRAGRRSTFDSDIGGYRATTPG